MRVTQARDHASLALEALAQRGIRGEMIRKPLERDGAIKTQLPVNVRSKTPGRHASTVSIGREMVG